METLSYKEVKARKEHQCNFCKGTIKKNEVYNNSSYADAGECWTWKSHLSCMKLTRLLDMEDDGEGITHDCFYGNVSGYYYENVADNGEYISLAKMTEYAVNELITKKQRK
jgi:hypothetical protein